VRIFLAVFPPPEVQAAAADLIERLRRPGDGVSWVKRENLHYTLRFMGELGEQGLERVTAAAREGAGDHAPFDAVLGAAGAFPRSNKARVLWLGLAEGGEALTAVAKDVERALRAAGFDRADQPFKSHLTIGRVRERDQDWSERLAGAALDPAPRFRVDRVQVIQSTLSPRGSRYDVRAEAALGA
jgi:RNA 2',3'-cyclic 3'-phosphodiesterase